MGLFTPSDKVASKKTKEEGCVITLQIEVPAAKVQDATHNALVRLQSQARLPGFRPGKAPLEMVQKQLAQSVKEKVIDDLLRDSVPKALDEHHLNPVATPAVHTIQMEPGKPLTFHVEIECAPQFQAKDYKKLPIKRKAYPATDAELDRRIQELREGNARLEKSSQEAVGKTHYAVFDYEAFADDKPVKDAKGVDVLLDMSSADAPEGFADGLLGAKRGETREVKSKLRGKPATFRVTIKELKEKILPKLDDDFAKDLGVASLSELQENLRKLMQEEGARKSEQEVLSQLEQGLLQRNPFPVPPSLAANALEHMLERFKKQIMGPGRDWPAGEQDKLKEKLRSKAEDEVRLSYLLRAIAQAEKLQVSEEDRKAELERNLQQAHTEEQKQDIKRFFEEKKEDVEAMLLERKTLELLKNSALVQDA